MDEQLTIQCHECGKTFYTVIKLSITKCHGEHGHTFAPVCRYDPTHICSIVQIDNFGELEKGTG